MSNITPQQAQDTLTQIADETTISDSEIQNYINQVTVTRVSVQEAGLNSAEANFLIDSEFVTEDALEAGLDVYVWRYDDPQFAEFYTTEAEAQARRAREVEQAGA